MTDLETYLDKLAGEPAQAAAHKAVAEGKEHPPTLLLLTCIDLRYPSIIHGVMEPRFHKLYDTVSLAGAGLAPVVDFGADRKPHWQQTFLEHVAISIALHGIRRVLVMEHRDCGAYRKFGLLTKEQNGTTEELNAHSKYSCRLAELLKREYPDLAYSAVLLPIEAGHDKDGKKVTVEVLELECLPKKV